MLPVTELHQDGGTGTRLLQNRATATASNWRSTIRQTRQRQRADEFHFRATLPTEGTFSLTDWGNRQRRKGGPRASFLAALLSTWRSAAAELLVLLLLIPYGSGLLLLAGNGTSSCGMRCCKRSKACSCRRSDKTAYPDGPGWIASSKCPGGCGQLPAVSASAAASLVVSRVEVSPIIPLSRVRPQAAPRRGFSETGFASCARPPPQSSPTRTS